MSDTTGGKRIPLFKPYVNGAARKNALDVLNTSWIGEGLYVKQFESELRDKFGWPFVSVLNSGTAGLYLALAVAGVGPGDEVITTPNTCTATGHAILAHYARPVYADIQYNTGNLHPPDIERHITPKTKAILPVHWAGYPCDLQEIHDIAWKHGLTVIEDAAHALGATYRGKPIGAVSRFTMFSFQAIKQLTTGDGGALAMTNGDDYNAARRRRWFGIDRDARRVNLDDGYAHWDQTEVGYKFHMNDIAAGIGLGNLQDIGGLLEYRHVLASLYRRNLAGVPGVALFERQGDRTSGDWLFTLHVERRRDFIAMLREQGVEASVVHTRNDEHTVFGGRRDDLPGMDRYEKTHVSIPIGWWVTLEDAERICALIGKGW